MQDHASRLEPAVVPAAENSVAEDEDRSDGNAALFQALAGFVERGLQEWIYVPGSGEMRVTDTVIRALPRGRQTGCGARR